MYIQNQHIPVLITEIVKIIREKLDFTKKLIIFDGTFGGGGYSQVFLRNKWMVFACDLDLSVIEKCNLNALQNLTLQHSNFADYIETFDDGFFDVIVLDLGFSSNQLATSQRGFSYLSHKDIFDLRYDQTQGQSVWQKIRGLKTPFELQKIIYTYSGERLSKKIAQNLFNLAKKRDSVIVGEIVESILEIIPQKFFHQTNSILSRVWQALRVWTNDEFDSLERFLKVAPNKIKVGGLIMIVSFNSLEDKLVTKFMRQISKPVEIDNFGNKIQNFKLLTKKPIKPTPQEIKENIRSRSAMLRILQKIN